MAKNRILQLPLQTRLHICDLLIDGASYDDLREALQGMHLPDADLPSDESLKNYQAGEEYQEAYRERVREYRRQNWRREPAVETADWRGRLLSEAMAELAFRIREGELSMADLLKALTFINRRDATELGRKRQDWKEQEHEAEQLELRSRQARHAQLVGLSASPPRPPVPSAAPAPRLPGGDAAPKQGVNPGKTEQNRVNPTKAGTPAGTPPPALTDADRRAIEARFGRAPADPLSTAMAASRA